MCPKSNKSPNLATLLITYIFAENGLVCAAPFPVPWADVILGVNFPSRVITSVNKEWPDWESFPDLIKKNEDLIFPLLSLRCASVECT